MSKLTPEPAISLQGVSKTFAIWDDPSARLLNLLRRMLGLKSNVAENRSFTAIQAIDLEIARGECLGIIGRNGAGKSTLLQIIAGTLQPTRGTVKVNGRVAALLELGSGFNPDFTGRENIHLNAAILGLSKPEIAAKLESIISYSGVEEFIDRPVRTYSSGMTLRLAFAVCVHVDAEILIIDEALAVGDARFQFKCHATLDQLQKEGRTIIFVSHDTNSVKRMCRTALLLERGEVLLQGSPNDVTNIYTKLITSPHGVEAIRGDIASLREQGAKSTVHGGRGDGEGSEEHGAKGEERGAKSTVDGGRGDGEGSEEHGAKGEEQGAQSTEHGGRSTDDGGAQEQGDETRAKKAGVGSPESGASSLPPQYAQSLGRPGPGTSLLTEERSHQQVSDKEYSYGGDAGLITAVTLTDQQDQPRLSFLTGNRIRVNLTCQAKQDIADPIYALTLKDIRGEEMYGTNTYFQNQTHPHVSAGSEVGVQFDLQLNVLPGVYFISLGWVRLENGEVQVIHRRYDVLRFDVLPCDKSFGLAYCPTTILVQPAISRPSSS